MRFKEQILIILFLLLSHPVCKCCQLFLNQHNNRKSSKIIKNENSANKISMKWIITIIISVYDLNLAIKNKKDIIPKFIYLINCFAIFVQNYTKQDHQTNSQKKKEITMCSQEEVTVHEKQKIIKQYQLCCKLIQTVANFDDISLKKNQLFLFYLNFLKFKRLRRFPSLKSTKILVGESGVGKSSLINTLFGTNESVALSDCTQSIKKVYSTNLVEIFDSSGELSSFDLSQVKVEKEFLDKESCPFETLAQYDEVYVLYDTSLKKIEQFVKALNALRTKGIYFVRNKCDTFDARQKRTVNQQLQVDRQLLQRWGVPAHKIVIFTASSENHQRFDNAKLKSQLLHEYVIEQY